MILCHRKYVRLSLRLKPKNVKNTVVNVDFWAEVLRGITCTLVQRATVLINTGRSRHVNLGLADTCYFILTSGHSDAQDWASECPDVKNYKWRLNPVWHRMLYSCTHMATVGFKGLTCRLHNFIAEQYKIFRPETQLNKLIAKVITNFPVSKTVLQIISADVRLFDNKVQL